MDDLEEYYGAVITIQSDLALLAQYLQHYRDNDKLIIHFAHGTPNVKTFLCKSNVKFSNHPVLIQK